LLLILAFSFLLISCKESTTTPTTTTTTTTSTTTTVEPHGPVEIRETGEDFDTIGDAMAAATAGQHLDVYAGTYTETLLVDKRLSFVGEDKTTTIIDGDGVDTVVQFTSAAEGSEISGFTVQNAKSDKAVIWCNEASARIEDMIVVSTSIAGIAVYLGPNTMIINVEQSGAGLYGIGINGGTPSVSETTIQGNEIGLWILAGSPRISSCSVKNNNSHGVVCSYSSTPDLGGGGSGSPGQNELRYNGSGWDLYNQTPNVIKAENNRWDHTTISLIDSMDVYDDDEDASYGAVDFDPFLTTTFFSSLVMKPQLLSASSLFADFFRSLFRADLPTSAISISSSVKARSGFARLELMMARYNSLADERYYPPIRLRRKR
jgi:hypothetical protein